MMRIRLPRLISAISLTTAALLMWTIVKYTTKQNFTQTCHHSEEFQEGLHRLADRVHHVLSSLGLSHFLCYGSLWGQLRLSRSLPWEPHVELCILNEEISLKDEVFLSRTFKKHSMQLDYDSTEGKYSITDNQLPGATVHLIVFEQDLLNRVKVLLTQISCFLGLNLPMHTCMFGSTKRRKWFIFFIFSSKTV
ncbi:uncharacterized protein LOC142331784 isoform X2 [Lycorma delicatula]|uniref:uncharacterized protein LOC142331784 isoform X2 n=1 Tax=Lycorma delicatula TaxID=130591 RepID=UPI003F5100AA